MEFIESQSIELEKTSVNFYQIVWRNFCRTHTIRLFSVSNSQSLYSSSKFNIRKFGNTVHFSPPTTLIYFNCSEDSDFIFTLIDDSKVYFIIFLFSLSLFICESNFFSSSHFAVVNHFRIPRRFPVFVIHLQLHLVVERLSLTDIFSFSSVADPRDHYTSYESWPHVFIILWSSSSHTSLSSHDSILEADSGVDFFVPIYFRRCEKVERYFSWFHNSFNLNIFYLRFFPGFSSGD